MADDIRIDPADAKRMVDSGKAIILDVVQPATWNQMPEAIRDALRIAPDEVANRLDELPTNRGVIAYCT